MHNLLRGTYIFDLGRRVLFSALLITLFFIPATVGAEKSFSDATGAFSTVITSEWETTTTMDGIEFTKGQALLSIENLRISTGETSEILALFTSTKETAAALAVGTPMKIDKPYPGLRTTLQGSNYSAVLVILKTPSGFYLISLEEAQPDQSNRQVFDTLLNSFALVETTTDPTGTESAATAATYSKLVAAVSTQTQLEPEIINDLYQKRPGLFSTVKATLATIQSFDQLAAAKDVESLAKGLTWKDQISTSASLHDFYAAIRSYKVSLGLLPKGTNPPEPNSELLQKYSTARTSGRIPIMAYNLAVATTGEFPGRQQLYAQVLKAKGHTAKTVKPELANYLKGKVDLYWRNRLEASYQLKQRQNDRSRFVDSLWSQRQQALDTIRSAAQP